MDRKVRQELFGLWCEPIFSVLLALGWLGLAHFWLPAPADLGPAATKAWFMRRRLLAGLA